jgi:hypothetical protein
MRKTSKKKKILTADDIAELAVDGEDISRFFTTGCWGRILTFYYFLSDFVYPSSKFAIPLNFSSNIIIPKCNT